MKLSTFRGVEEGVWFNNQGGGSAIKVFSLKYTIISFILVARL